MLNPPKLSRYEFETIRQHNEKLADGMRNTIAMIRGIKPAERPAYLQGQLWYCLDVVSALEWSTKIAAQSAGVAYGVQRFAK